LVSYRFSFELSDKCIVENLGNSDNIEFRILEEGSKKYVTGFSILMENLSRDVAKYGAMQKATVLSNVISVRYGRYTHAHLIGYNRILKSGKQRVSREFRIRSKRIRKLDFSLKNEEISSLMDNVELNQLYEHASRGIKADDDEDPVTMIREFYQVIEKKNVNDMATNLRKFKWLRDTLSHNPKFTDRAIKNLKIYFRNNYFVFTPSGHFDYTSPKNIERLKSQARSLMKKALVNLHTIH
jgi:hypothetical protein